MMGEDMKLTVIGFFGLGIAALAIASHPVAQKPKFSHPTRITNRHLPLGKLHRDVLEGIDHGHKVRVVRTSLPGAHALYVGGKRVAAKVVEDKEFKDGKLTEITRDYFAQSDEGSVYYLGEDVDQYRDGQIVAHDGAWLSDKNGAKAAVVMPAHLKVGSRFRSEDAPKNTREVDLVVSTSETVKVPAGVFKRCIKIREVASDGDVEFKYYAPGIGVVRESDKDVDLRLISHT